MNWFTDISLVFLTISWCDFGSSSKWCHWIGNICRHFSEQPQKFQSDICTHCSVTRNISHSPMKGEWQSLNMIRIWILHRYLLDLHFHFFWLYEHTFSIPRFSTRRVLLGSWRTIENQTKTDLVSLACGESSPGIKGM